MTIMKHVNFDPELELKKARIMEEFKQDDGPGESETRGTFSDGPVAEIDESELREGIVEALKTVYDPEIPVNIFDLGLIYDIRIRDRVVEVDMTLTAPGCPVAHTFPGMVERTVAMVPGVAGAIVDLVWDPPWTPDLISEAARLELGLI